MPDRPRPMSDDELGDALTRLGEGLDYPAPHELPSKVAARMLEAPEGRPAAIPGRPTWRDRLPWLGRRAWRGAVGPRRPAWQPLLAAVVLVLAVFAASLVAFPSVRETVADWLGLRGIGISVVPSLSPIPTQHRPLQLGTPVSLAEAQATVAWRILLPEDPLLGPPDEVYLDRGRTADGIVSLVWTARPGLPVASTTDAGLVLTEFRGYIDQTYFNKVVGAGTTVVRTRVGGDFGFWLSGAQHQIYLIDPHGKMVVETGHLAGDVLLWEHGELTLRIESALAKDEVIGLAVSVR